MTNINLDRKLRRKRRVSSNIHGTNDKPRISVFRSSRFIYAQSIDDKSRKTILSFSNTDLKKTADFKKDKKSSDSKKIGIGLAKKLLEKKILTGSLTGEVIHITAGSKRWPKVYVKGD